MKSALRKSYPYALAAILAWSTVSTAFKLSLRYLSPLGLLLFSALTATVFLAGVNQLKYGAAAWKSIGRNLRASALAGLLNPFIYYLMLFVAYNRLRAQEAQVLNYTWAIVLSVLSILILKERFRVRDLLALCLSFLGVVVISTRGRILELSFTDPLGSALAVSTSLIWAFYWIINMRDERPAERKLFYNFAVGSALISLYALLICQFGGGKLFTGRAGLGWGILGAVYVGILEMGLTFILWLKALQIGKNTPLVANLIFITPFISLLFIAIILQEKIAPATLLGLLIIVGSNILQKLPAKTLR